ncbi:mitochondrial genome maintenance exonuclease 1, DNA complex, DNA exonuclease [Drosophila suzukii associated hytrosavirus 1]|nr:mitochondrial genome maintenance exonuclease 1, DNA complex, DNA exonuclease [Drosophila suzukii associated hytrosavirus 1]
MFCFIKFIFLQISARISQDFFDDSDDEKDISNFNQQLYNNFINVKLFHDELKYQKTYLSPYDQDIAFDEVKHTYLLPNAEKKFQISVTGFLKSEVQKKEFKPYEIIRNVIPDNISKPYEYDIHIHRLIEWKYASVFGSLFHALVEYFFENIVNNCPHKICKLQEYDRKEYIDLQIDETNIFQLSHNVLSQAPRPHKSFEMEPRMPCMYALENFDMFANIVLEEKNFLKFIRNNVRYNIDFNVHKKDILNNMELAFDNGTPPMKYEVRRYRQSMEDIPYEQSIDEIIFNLFDMRRYIEDLTYHFKNFRCVLMHLPLRECFDIRPEYIVFSEKHGLAGSVDLTMRLRNNPRHLLIYDWKTCKQIFRSYYRENTPVTQIIDYACQLHTYANIIRERNNRYIIDLFVVNVNNHDCCIYNTRCADTCMCTSSFENFRLPLIDL